MTMDGEARVLRMRCSLLVNSPIGEPRMRILFHEYGLQLRLEDDDRLVLDVLCGGVAEFGVEFALNDEERNAYKSRGDSFVRELAALVRGAPRTFSERGRVC